MFNEQVYNAVQSRKERKPREVSIKYGDLLLHDGEKLTAKISYLEGKSTSRDQEQTSRDEGVFYNKKKGVKTIKITGRISAESREDLLNKVEKMKASLSKNKSSTLQVKEGERIREWECVVSRFSLNEESWNIDWMQWELELLTRDYARNPEPRTIQQTINQNLISIPIERGGTAPSQVGFVYTVSQAGEGFVFKTSIAEISTTKRVEVGNILKLEGKKLTLNGEEIAFNGVYPRLEKENETLTITTESRGEIQIFYFLCYE